MRRIEIDHEKTDKRATKRLRETRVRQTFRDLEIHNDRNKTKSGQTEQ